MDAAGLRPSARLKTFVGRREERSLLRHLLREVAEGQPAVVVVAGVAGAGKTALLRWLGNEAAAIGAVALFGIGGDDDLPGVWFERLIRPLSSTAATRLSAIAGTSDDLTSDSDAVERRLGDEVTDIVITAARRRLVVILLDDLHDLDSAPGRVLARILEGIDASAFHGAASVLVVLASREPFEAGGPVERALRFDLTRSIHIGGLAEEDVVEFVLAAGVGGDPAAIAALLEDTDGLPLLVEASVDALRDTSAPTAGRRRSRARVRSVAEALERRFEKIDDATRKLLVVAAHLGEPWEPSDVAAAAGVSMEVVDEALRPAVDGSLIMADRDRWRFAHPLVRSALLDETDAAERAALHLRIARLLQRRDDRSDANLVRIADHLLRAGAAVGPDEVAQLGRRAGQAAVRAGAWRQASRFLAAAAAAGDESVGARTIERAERHLEAGRAAFLDHDPDTAETELGRAISLATASGGDQLRAEAAVLLVRTRLAERPQGMGQRPEIGELEDALERPGVDAGCIVDGRATMAEALFVSGESDKALAMVAAARAVEVHGDATRAACRLAFAEGLHRLFQLELERARSCFDRTAEHALEAQDPLWSVFGRSRALFVRYLQGDVAAARRDLTALERDAGGHRYFGEAAFASAQLALAAVLDGRDTPAVAIEQALALYRRSGHIFSAVVAEPAALALGARLGEPDPPGWAGVAGVAERRPSAVAMLTAVEAGAVDAARVRLGTAKWRHGLLGPAHIGNLAIIVAMVEAGDLLGDRDLVTAARRPLDELSERGMVVVMSWPALVPRLSATVARWDDRPSDAQRHLEHAVGVCDANGLPAELARAHLELAQLAVAEGRRRDEAGAFLGAALREFDELDMHGWAARCDRLAQDLGLSSIAGIGRGVRVRTFLTTDIVGSTAANVRLGDALYLEQLRIHDRLVTARIREFRGQIIKHTGDGMNACFSGSADALRCALALQRDFAHWGADEPELALGMRCGVARGAVIPSGGDYFGVAQAETARLCGLAGQGEIVASALVVENAAIDDLAVTDLGLVQLRGLPAAAHVFRVGP